MVEPVHPVDLRVSLANERTLLSWIRTGLALMGFGFVVERLALWLSPEPSATSPTATLAIGAGIVGLGAICQIVGAVRFMAVKRALGEGRTPQPGTAGPMLLAALAVLVGVALFVYLLTG
jgi:putative membrane protein